MEARIWDVVNMGEDICEPGLRIDIVEACGDDKGIHGGGAFSPPIGAGEQPGFSAQSYTAQSAFCRIICETDPAISKEPCEHIRSSEKIGHGLGNGVFGRHAPAGIAHPVEQSLDQRGDALLTDGQPMCDGRAVDRAFGIEYGIDPAHGLYGERCLVFLGNLEQPPASMRPATGRDHRRRLTARFCQSVISGIGIGL